MVRPPQVCAAQVGLPSQVGNREMGEGSKEASRCLVHKPQKKKVKDNVLEQSYEEQTKGICEDS